MSQNYSQIRQAVSKVDVGESGKEEERRLMQQVE